MKKTVLILLIIILSGCHQSSHSGEILSETFYYYDIIEGQIGQKKYSDCKECNNGQLVKSYKISSDNEIYNEKEYKYKGDLTGKTLFEYDGDTKTTSFYDDKDIFQKQIETKDEWYVYSETLFFHDDLSIISEYVLDDNDRIIKIVNTTEYKITTSEIIYDDYGNKLTSFTSTEKIKERENQGNLSEVYSDVLIEYEYLYDKQGQYTEMKMYMNDELVQYVIRKIIYQE